MNRDFALPANATRGKGPRTKKQARRKRDALLHPDKAKAKNWAPRVDGDPEAVQRNGTLAERSATT